MITAIILLVVAILLVLLINEACLDAVTARVLRILIIAGALIFVAVYYVPRG